jgi:hypothetical protein
VQVVQVVLHLLLVVEIEVVIQSLNIQKESSELLVVVED